MPETNHKPLEVNHTNCVQQSVLQIDALRVERKNNIMKQSKAQNR